MSLFRRPPFIPVTEVFVETGTYLGDGVASALSQGYRECVSIEQCHPYHERSVERFRGASNVRLLLGSSPAVLPDAIDPDRMTTFWLDAHYSGLPDQLDREHGECPLLAELDAITRAPWRAAHYVLVDDAFMFFDWRGEARFAPFSRNAWPSFAEIEARAPGYEFCIYPTHDAGRLVEPCGMLIGRCRRM